ncbi:MAG: hypothetical protein IT215_03350 [Chitinophagaceae bacterium]|nr:hypothetical protein [Chitinophagaceae bacterium]
MKYIIIDDNISFAKALCGQLLKEANGNNNDKTCNEKLLQFKHGEETITIDFAKHTTAQIADAIIETYANEEKKLPDDTGKKKLHDDTVLFINVNLKTKDGNRQNQKGIELLIWLRIKGIMNHCVMYSFETLHALLNRHTKHLIATSKGTTFVQLPSDFKHLDLIKLCKEKADENNLKNTLKAIFNKDNQENIATFRHKDANWWGVKVMFDAYRVIESKPNINYPDSVNTKLSDITNAVARFIYENKFTIDNIRNIEEEEREKRIAEIKTVIEGVKEKIKAKENSVNTGEEDKQKLQEFLEGINQTLITLNDENLRKERDKIMIEIETWSSLIADEKTELENAEDEKRELETTESELIQELKNIATIVREKYKELLTDYSTIKANITSQKPKILYIDDNAKNGWETLLQTVLGNKVTITSIVPDKEKYKNEILQLYNDEVKNNIYEDTSLILLDLRLFDEDERSVEIQSISGKKLLDIIRQHHKGIPVLIITASNKVWSYEQLIKSGADAYWMKEGIDNNFTAEESVKNYYKLLWLIEKLTGEEYKPITKLSKLIDTINQTANWWESKDWTRNNPWSHTAIASITNCAKKDITEILNDSLDLLKEYVQKNVLRQRYVIKNSDWLEPSLIIQHLGKIIEAIHQLGDAEYNAGNRSFASIINGFWDTANQKFILYRGDFRGKQIFIFRNQASHYSKSVKLNFKALEFYITILEDYLLNDDVSFFGNKKVISQTSQNGITHFSLKEPHTTYNIFKFIIEKKNPSLRQNVTSIKVEALDYFNKAALSCCYLNVQTV